MASDRTCTAPSTTPDGVDLGGALPRRTTSVRRVGWRHSAVACAAAAAAASWSCLPLDVHAQQQPQPAVLARAEVSLGRARLRTAITVRTVDAGRAELEITAGAHRVLAPVAPRGVAIRWAAVRDVEIARDVHAAVVLASVEAPPGGARAMPERGWVGVIGLGADGAPALVIDGPLALEGDIGERAAVAVTLDDLTRDGFSDVVAGHRIEGSRLCGATRLPLVDPVALDPATLRLRRVELSPLRDQAGSEEGVTARDGSPGPTGAPVARVATWESASSSARTAAGAFRRAPLELGDGRRETAWVFARARFDHATARITPGAGAIRAIALDLTPADATLARRYRRLRTLWLVGDSGARLRVTIPGDALLRPDGRYWIVPPRPLAWSCISIVVGDTYGDGSATTAAIADVAVYTDLDFGEGLGTLAARLEEGRHSEAAEALARAGLRGAEAVIARWTRMGEQGRLRALGVLDRIAEAARGASDEAAVRDRVSTHLVTAFDDPSPTVAERTYGPLGRLDPPAVALVEASLQGTDEPRALRALDVLAASTSDLARPLLVAALADSREIVRHGAARALGRHVLVRMSPRGGGGGTASASAIGAIVDALASDTRVGTDVVARVLVDLSRLAVLSEPIGRAIGALWPRATTLADRYRLVRAAARTSSVEASRDVLRSAADRGDPWPVRALAVSALGTTPEPEQDLAILGRRLDDEAVRVRVAAVRALGPHRSAEDAVVRRLAADRWPLVRAAALEALARPEAGPAARSAIVRAVEDRSWSVRVSAIRALGPTGVRDADARVLARLRDARETSEVRRAAVELIESRCWRSARAALLAVLRERPETLSDEWVSLGVSAWRALHRLGPSSELREAEGFGRGLPADLQREVRRARPCVPRESGT